ncbi:MAG: hypothetical protein JXQ93_07930 [Flavobacteriaceae bacterium]
MKLPLHYPISILFLFLFFVGQAQENDQPIDSSYVNYFKNSREIPYLHLNKTTFLKGEEIWFQAYVLEQGTKKLHQKTSNLYVSIFNQDGTLKEQKIIYIDKGIGKGNILLDSSFTKKKYYLHASTNWMRNFKEDQSFLQEIDIVNAKEVKKKVSMLKEESFFDFQVFPEGGHLLSEVSNTIGILIKNKNGKGQVVKNGVLKNSKGKVISVFTTNKMGIGSTTYIHDANEEYIAEATLQNGSIISKSLPKAQKYGVALNVYNPGTPIVNITLNTNRATLKSLIGKKYHIWIHNTTTYFNMDVVFQPNNNSYSILIKKDKLAKGVNIITVFDDKNQPILERLVFNYDKDLLGNIFVESTQQQNDSINIQLKGNTNEKVFLSTSFLPAQTKAYIPSNSLYSSFLLKPYIKGDVENSNYYFTNTNRKKLQELDKLLLTQGWSKYSWDRIFNNTNTFNFKFESGITIKGKLNNPLKKGERLLVLSKENNLLNQLDVTNNEFTIKNYLLQKNSELGFAIETKKRIIKARPILQYSKNLFLEKLDKTRLSNKITSELEISGFKSLLTDRKLLDEVRITTKRVEYKHKPYGGMAMLTGYKIADRLNTDGETLEDFLREKRFDSSKQQGNLVISTGRRGGAGASRGPASTANANQPGRFGGIRVFLDDNDITDSLWQIENLFLNAVEEVFIGQLTDTWSTWQIYIYSATPKKIIGKKNPFQNITLTHGFEKVKEYYQPKYPAYLNDTYVQYGALFWKPSIKVSGEKAYQFSIPKNLQENIVMFVEGISESGKLISKKILLNNKHY